MVVGEVAYYDGGAQAAGWVEGAAGEVYACGVVVSRNEESGVGWEVRLTSEFGCK